jgi:hypothetical protein
MSLFPLSWGFLRAFDRNSGGSDPIVSSPSRVDGKLSVG